MKRCAVTPYKGEEKYIFVSYCHKDARYVFPMIEQMARDGYRIWYDEGIDPGSEWPETIAHYLNASAACIAVISENAVNSHNCRREINFALLKKKPFLSVILHDVPLSLGMEMQLSATQAIFKHLLPAEEFLGKLYSSAVLEGCRGERQDDIVVSSPEEYISGFSEGNAAKTFKDTWFCSSKISEVSEEPSSEPAEKEATAEEKHSSDIGAKEAERGSLKKKKVSTPAKKNNAETEGKDTPIRKRKRSSGVEKATSSSDKERELEECARQEAEARARQEAEDRARQEAEDRARREAEDRARQEAEDRARREAEDRARQEAEDRARQEAEDRARREAEDRLRWETEECIRRETENRIRWEMEERLRREAEECIRREAEDRIRWEIEGSARRREELLRFGFDREIGSVRRETGYQSRRDKMILLGEAGGRRLQGTQSEKSARCWLIRIKNGERVDLRDGETRIGRARETNDLVIDDNSAVGRRHATIIKRDGMCVLIDHHSANGTFINSRRIEPEQEYLLANGYNIRVANEKLMFFQREGNGGNK